LAVDWLMVSVFSRKFRRVVATVSLVIVLPLCAALPAVAQQVEMSPPVPVVQDAGVDAVAAVTENESENDFAALVQRFEELRSQRSLQQRSSLRKRKSPRRRAGSKSTPSAVIRNFESTRRSITVAPHRPNTTATVLSATTKGSCCDGREWFCQVM